MLRAVAQGLGVVVVVLAISIALVGAPIADVAVPAAWAAVAAGVAYTAGVMARIPWVAWTAIVVLLVYTLVVAPGQWPLFVPFALLMALALLILTTRPADLRTASEPR